MENKVKELKPGLDYPGNCVVFLCHDGAGNIVLAKRSKNTRNEPGTWDIGGGGIEHGVSKLETVQAEIKQEYCAEVLACEEVGNREVMVELRDPEGNPKKNHWYAFDFIVRVRRDEVQIGEPHKFDELKWFRFDNLPPDSELYKTLPTFLKKNRAAILEALQY